jgi:outer membrane protein assembly factor BamB
MASAEETGPALFDTEDRGAPPSDVPVIQPWKQVALDPDYGGLWFVAGDVDGDGEAEIVTCENVNVGDVHHTSTAVAQKLDGTVLWRWGDPAAGRKNWHHDVACQIHDWDGDGANEVVLAADGFVVELNGATGEEKRRLPIPKESSDCIVFCDLSGVGRPTDFLVKTRYHQIWAFDREGKELWTVTDPGGYPTAHQPRPMDIDGDGRDELMAGYAMLNADGSVRWVFKAEKQERVGGHLDCARVLKQGTTPEDMRIAFTCCGGNNIALVDGNGAVQWEVSGEHFESLQVGRIIPEKTGLQILVDVDHAETGPLWVIDEDGEHLGRLTTDYSRHHRLVDWTGDGFDNIVVGNSQGVYDHRGQRIATLAMPEESRTGEAGGFETSALVGDMTGDGVPDILLATPEMVSIFKNENGRKPDGPAALGTGLNVTLY